MLNVRLNQTPTLTPQFNGTTTGPVTWKIHGTVVPYDTTGSVLNFALAVASDGATAQIQPIAIGGPWTVSADAPTEEGVATIIEGVQIVMPPATGGTFLVS